MQISLLNPNNYATDILENWQKGNLFNVENVNSAINYNIDNVQKSSNDNEIIVNYSAINKNYHNNIKTKIVTLTANNNTTLEEYKQKIKELYLNDLDNNENEYNPDFYLGIKWDKSYSKKDYDHKSIFYKYNGILKRDYKRTSKIDQDEEEIKELENIFNELHSSYEIDGYDLRTQFFNARNMTEAMLKWFDDFWLDHIYTNLEDFSTDFYH